MGWFLSRKVRFLLGFRLRVNDGYYALLFLAGLTLKTFKHNYMTSLFSYINRLQIPFIENGRWFAPVSSTPSPSRYIDFIDKSVFKKSKGEKELIKVFKKELPKTRGYKFKVVTKFSI